MEFVFFTNIPHINSSNMKKIDICVCIYSIICFVVYIYFIKNCEEKNIYKSLENIYSYSPLSYIYSISKEDKENILLYIALAFIQAGILLFLLNDCTIITFLIWISIYLVGFTIN